VIKFCTGSSDEKTWEWKAVEPPQLKTVAMKHPVKVGKRLSEYCSDLQSVEIRDSTVITGSSKWCL
jgi:hypothetical protein